MGKYFGTDGIRGVANKDLTPELAYKVGRIGAYVLTKKTTQPTVLIGRDTRISGEMLENAMVAGILSIGANVIKLGVISTPGVAYLTKALKADAGVMISASHNPVEDNGIKFFGADGFKLSDETELEIEELMDQDDLLPRPISGDIGRVIVQDNGKELYIEHLIKSVGNNLKGLKVVLDTANGAAYEIAPAIFSKLGAEVIAIHHTPDGVNINKNAGSTHPEVLATAVLENKADLGLAYDGDADRLIAIDEKGSIIDGDYILFVLGKFLKEKGLLKNNTVVSTVMSNIGFYKALEANGISSLQTKVGDRYVMEGMREKGLNIGGEQSGHLILLDYNTTGDGILTSIHLANIIKEKNLPLSALVVEMEKYPQVLENVRVSNKEKLNDSKEIQRAIKNVEERLQSSGRVLVRPSGTEQLVRVMIEGPDEELLKKYVSEIVDIVKKELS